jgi:hypothetical protein
LVNEGFQFLQPELLGFQPLFLYFDQALLLPQLFFLAYGIQGQLLYFLLLQYLQGTQILATLHYTFFAGDAGQMAVGTDNARLKNGHARQCHGNHSQQ